MRTSKEPTDVLTGTELRSPCRYCGHSTVHLVRRSMEVASRDGDASFSVDFRDDYQILECKGCQEVRFRHSHENSEDTIGDEFEQHSLVTVELYPNDSPSLVDGVEFVPGHVRQVYEESVKALRDSLVILAGVGIRATVEAMCKDLGIEGRYLWQRIDGLADNGYLASSGVEHLKLVKDMGNAAAHEIRSYPIADLRLALDVTEHALRAAYVMPEKGSRLPGRESP